MGIFDGQDRSQRFIREVMNVGNWAKTRKLKHSVWVALPNVRTSFKNKLTMEVERTTPERPFVVSGLLGSIETIQESDLYNSYTFLNNRRITPLFLDSKQVNGKIDWFQVDTIADNQVYWAFLVDPSRYGDLVKDFYLGAAFCNRVINEKGVKHGFGDVLICRDANGIPDFQSIYVENGLNFVAVYDLKNMPDKLKNLQSMLGVDQCRVSSKPSYRVISQVDTHIDQQMNSYKEFKSDLDNFLKDLNQNYYHVQCEQDGFSAIQTVIETISGKVVGFSILFDGEQKGHAKIKMFVAKRGMNYTKKIETDGYFQSKRFINYLRKLIS